MSKKSPPPAPPRTSPLGVQVRRLARFAVGPGRRTAIALLVALAAGGGANLVWRNVRDRVLSHEDYLLLPKQITVTPLPAWIHRDLKAEVLRDGELLSGQSILDEGLAERIAKQFRLHPWVAEVKGVQLTHPSGADVKLSYRVPVAMVELRGQDRPLIPVDAEAIVLPESDFSAEDRQKYPLITGIATEPRVDGSKWGDLRLLGAVRIAALFGDDWQKLQLRSIVPADPTRPSRASDDAMYEIYTQHHTRIQWGSPPGSERSNEPLALEKKDRLLEFALENGSLDGKNGPQLINLREPGPIRAREKSSLGTLPTRDDP